MSVVYLNVYTNVIINICAQFETRFRRHKNLRISEALFDKVVKQLIFNF